MRLPPSLECRAMSTHRKRRTGTNGVPVQDANRARSLARVTS